MKLEVKNKLLSLKADYESVMGNDFQHFYCPILHLDEDTELCKAHLVNQAFEDSPKNWTVQRADIDSFYGSKFESEFVKIQYRNMRLGKIVTDPTLSKKVDVEILLDEKNVDFHWGGKNDTTSSSHSTVLFETEEANRKLILHVSDNDLIKSKDKNWRIQISKDVRLDSFVSLLKSAYLIMFDLLGYRYAFSLGGRFLGYDILGKFYIQNKDKSKSEIPPIAYKFFQEYFHMMRPIQSQNLDLKGTSIDKKMLLCKNARGDYWAIIVVVNTGNMLHAILTPVFDLAENVETFLSFLKNEQELITANLCKFDGASWQIDKTDLQMTWIKKDVKYPKLNI